MNKQLRVSDSDSEFFVKTIAIFGISDTIGDGGIAQLGEHMHHTHGVAGSSPVVSIFYFGRAAEMSFSIPKRYMGT